MFNFKKALKVNQVNKSDVTLSLTLLKMSEDFFCVLSECSDHPLSIHLEDSPIAVIREIKDDIENFLRTKNIYIDSAHVDNNVLDEFSHLTTKTIQRFDHDNPCLVTEELERMEEILLCVLGRLPKSVATGKRSRISALFMTLKRNFKHGLSKENGVLIAA